MVLSKKQLAREVITVRYPRPSNPLLSEYFANYGTRREDIDFLLGELMEILEHPLEWPGYRLPEGLRLNTRFFNKAAKKLVEDFRVAGSVSPEAVGDFLLRHHQVFKYGTQRWLLANAGIALEQFTITESRVEKNFFAALLERGVKPGDQVVHLHIVSNNEREELRQRGFEVPHKHWDESYYRAALQTVGEMLASNQDSVGLFCEDSWVFDPTLHRIASDGWPLVAFGFLKDDLLVGERFFVGLALPDNDYAKQYEFALRSPRRLALHQQGEFTPKTYGAFYPREALLVNLREIVK